MFKYGQQYSQHCFRKNFSSSSCSVERHMMFAGYLLSQDACNAYHYFRLSQSMCKTQNYNQRNSKTRKVSYSTKEWYFWTILLCKLQIVRQGVFQLESFGEIQAFSRDHCTAPSWELQSGSKTSGGSHFLVKVWNGNDFDHFLIDRPSWFIQYYYLSSYVGNIDCLILLTTTKEYNILYTLQFA